MSSECSCASQIRAPHENDVPNPSSVSGRWDPPGDDREGGRQRPRPQHSCHALNARLPGFRRFPRVGQAVHADSKLQNPPGITLPPAWRFRMLSPDFVPAGRTGWVLECVRAQRPRLPSARIACVICFVALRPSGRRFDFPWGGYAGGLTISARASARLPSVLR